MLPSGATVHRPFSMLGTASANWGTSDPWSSVIAVPALTRCSSASEPAALVGLRRTEKVGGSLKIAAVTRFGTAGAGAAAPLPELAPEVEAGGAAQPYAISSNPRKASRVPVPT